MIDNSSQKIKPIRLIIVLIFAIIVIIPLIFASLFNWKNSTNIGIAFKDLIHELLGD